MEGWRFIIRNNRFINCKKKKQNNSLVKFRIFCNYNFINNKKKKKGNSLIEVQLFFLIIIVLISFQLVIVDHRYKELINREEIIENYINRENDVSASEIYIKEMIIENNILSEEDFKNKIKVCFKSKKFNIYELTYDQSENIFMLINHPSKSVFYYRLTFNSMIPNLTERT